MINILSVIFVAAAPISELRAAIPLAIHVFGFNAATAISLSIFGTMLPALALAFFLEPAIGLTAKHWPWFHGIVMKHLETARVKTKKAVERFGFFGLLLFVAAPLPFFGVYTGAAGAVLLGMPRLRIILASFAGTCLAAGIVYFLDFGITKLF